MNGFFVEGHSPSRSISLEPWERPDNELENGICDILRGSDWTLTSRDPLRHDAQVMPRRLPALGVGLLGVVIAHPAGNDDVLALLAVRRRRHLLLRGQLQRIDHAH